MLRVGASHWHEALKRSTHCGAGRGRPRRHGGGLCRPPPDVPRRSLCCTISKLGVVHAREDSEQGGRLPVELLPVGPEPVGFTSQVARPGCNRDLSADSDGPRP